MDLMVLKIPPDKVAKVSSALENWADNNPGHQDTQDIDDTVTWLNYRLSKWYRNHPAPTQE